MTTILKHYVAPVMSPQTHIHFRADSWRKPKRVFYIRFSGKIKYFPAKPMQDSPSKFADISMRFKYYSNVGPFHFKRDCRPVCVWLTCPMPPLFMLRFVHAEYHFRSVSWVCRRDFSNFTLLTSCWGLPLTFSVDLLIQFRNNITGLVVIWSFKGLRVYRKSIINSFELIFVSKLP